MTNGHGHAVNETIVFSHLFTQKNKNKNVKNIEQCSSKYILDLSRGNVKVKITIKEKFSMQNSV